MLPSSIHTCNVSFTDNLFSLVYCESSNGVLTVFVSHTLWKYCALASKVKFLLLIITFHCSPEAVYVYVVEDFPPCPITCGPVTLRIRDVDCEKREFNQSSGEMVDINFCRAFSDEAEPSSYTPCDILPCPVWQAEEFGEVCDQWLQYDSQWCTIYTLCFLNKERHVKLDVCCLNTQMYAQASFKRVLPIILLPCTWINKTCSVVFNIWRRKVWSSSFLWLSLAFPLPSPSHLLYYIQSSIVISSFVCMCVCMCVCTVVLLFLWERPDGAECHLHHSWRRGWK